jgi:EAL domain-containing protein (putative c-di-GMP-specific phosphodiesterase class I)
VKTGIFDEALYGEPAENLSLISEMQDAMANGGLTVHYQPKLNLRTGDVTSAEALVRWTHPRRGPISPELFVGMAEETGHIRHLTNFVLAQAMADQAAMAQAGHVLRISVNMSGRLLGDELYGRSLLKQIRARRGPLCFEITETAVIENEVAAFKLLDALRAEGIDISIDDYGSGLSSLAYLKVIQAQELKIDRAFISDMARSERDALLVRSMIDLAHALGMSVTAEGVEDEPVLSLLRVMGCDQAQGFGFARPMPVNELLRFLADNHAERPARTGGDDSVEIDLPGRGPGLGADRGRLRSV